MELWVAFGFGAAVGALIGYVLGRQTQAPAPSRARPAPPSQPPPSSRSSNSASPDVKHVVLDEGAANVLNALNNRLAAIGGLADLLHGSPLDPERTLGRRLVMGFGQAPGRRGGAAPDVAVSLHAVGRRWRGGVRARPGPRAVGGRQPAAQAAGRQHRRRSGRDLAAQPAGRADTAALAGGKPAAHAHPRRGRRRGEPAGDGAPARARRPSDRTLPRSLLGAQTPLPSPAESLPRMRILVVDDDAVNRQAMVLLLEREGHQIGPCRAACWARRHRCPRRRKACRACASSSWTTTR